MKIRGDVYLILIGVLVILVCVAFFGMYQYNDKRNEIVADLESQGYVCQKDILGFYRECLSPDYVDQHGIDFTIDLNISTGVQNG